MESRIAKFDFPIAIKELAEVRLRCPGGAIAFNSEPDQQWLCGHSDHGYTGYYAPFASLRADFDKHYSCRKQTYCLRLGEEPDYGTRGWVPESDVRVVCWELEKVAKQLDTLAFTVQHRNGYWEWYDPRIDGARQAASAEEAQIRAAQAWVKEQYA